MAVEQHMQHPWDRALAFLGVTGGRWEEVGAMRWDEIEGDFWVPPPERYKTEMPYVLPLSSVVQRILRETPPIGPFVFGVVGRSRLSGWSGGKARLDSHVRIKHW